MPISIIIINYNNAEDTIACVESLTQQTVNGFNIVIVDNASTDNSVSTMRDCFDKRKWDYLLVKANETFVAKRRKIYLLSNPQNSGFSGGNNFALTFVKQFLESNYVLLLNNDTVLPADFLANMKKAYLEKKSTVSSKIAMGAREINYYTGQFSHTGFQYLHLLTGLVFHRPIFPSTKYICGACLMLDIDAPLLDDSYFLYYDDAEYTKILCDNGYTLCVTDQAIYQHKISATTSRSGKMIYHQFVSMWHFYQKHYPLLIPSVLLLRVVQYFLTRKKEIVHLLVQTLKQTLK